MTERAARAQAFVEKLLQLLGHHDGYFGVRWEQLRELVQEDPDAAAGAVPALIRMGEQQRGFLQVAYSVAIAYQAAIGDDSLTCVVQEAMKRSGVAEPTYQKTGRKPEQEEPEKKIFQLAVDRNDLERCEIYPWTRMLSLESLEGAAPDHAAALRRMRGRCLLAFPSLDADPRAVWHIPEARAYVRALYKAMPYFPYYLHTHALAGTFMLFFGCLADPDAMQRTPAHVQESKEQKSLRKRIVERIKSLRKQGKAVSEEVSDWVLDIMHPTVLRAVFTTVISLPAFCDALEEDPAPVIQAVLASYPETVRQDMLSRVASAVRQEMPSSLA